VRDVLDQPVLPALGASVICKGCETRQAKRNQSRAEPDFITIFAGADVLLACPYTSRIAMKDFNDGLLSDNKKGGYERVEDAVDDQDDNEPPAYEDVANALGLLVERDGSRRRIYKRQDTGEILYTTRNFNGWLEGLP
jgi:hypothetical protein